MPLPPEILPARSLQLGDFVFVGARVGLVVALREKFLRATDWTVHRGDDSPRWNYRPLVRKRREVQLFWIRPTFVAARADGWLWMTPLSREVIWDYIHPILDQPVFPGGSTTPVRASTAWVEVSQLSPGPDARWRGYPYGGLPALYSQALEYLPVPKHFQLLLSETTPDPDPRWFRRRSRIKRIPSHATSSS